MKVLRKVEVNIPPEAFTMEPENDGFQKESPFPVADFQVNHVKLRGVTLKNPTTEC